MRRYNQTRVARMQVAYPSFAAILNIQRSTTRIAKRIAYACAIAS
ncbi:hypothetical protein RRSWK_03759 [Rhodopirellula sp. SWK7]|nr:hypothetical protein RRSWK_03759 [Rhodopirellula sp. SWK7]